MGEALRVEEQHATWRPAPERSRRLTLVEKPVEDKMAKFSRSTYDSLLAFKKFIEENRRVIEARVAKGEKVADVLYDIFYSEDSKTAHYKDDDPNFLRTKHMYEQQANEVGSRLWQMSEKRRLGDASMPDISPGTGSIEAGWVYFKVNGGLKKGEPVGRLYLNIEPSQVPQLYLEAMRQFSSSEPKNGVEAKISRTGTAQDLNRSDKMIIYFNSGNEQAVYKIVEELYQKQPQSFLEPQPRFTTRLTDRVGRPMPGLSFGEEPPSSAGGKSFGGARSEILAQIYQQYFPGIKEAEKPWKKLATVFQDLCSRQGIDPENSAFNLSSRVMNHFSLMREKSQ